MKVFNKSLFTYYFPYSFLTQFMLLLGDGQNNSNYFVVPLNNVLGLNVVY